MKNWQLIRTAHQLARLGTISATAKELGIHRATVLRHIDSLEADLGIKLFQRNPRGYIATEAGTELMRVVSTTDDQFSQIFNKLKQTSAPLSGDFVVTSLAPLVSIMMPILKAFQSAHPSIQLRYIISEDLFRLEYGEAHVAVRTGSKPDSPDNVVLPFVTNNLTFVAHKDYLRKFGTPVAPKALTGHRIVSMNELKPKVPIHKWLLNNIRDEDIVFRSNDSQALLQAILNSIGIGIMFDHETDQYPELVKLFQPIKEWEVQHWLVTHGDLHRSNKVQAFLKVVRTL